MGPLVTPLARQSTPRRDVGIFPDDAVVIRLVGAVPLDMHAERISSDRRYLCDGSMTKLYDPSANGDNAVIESGG